MMPLDHPAEKVAGAPAAHSATDETNTAIDNEHNMTVRQSLRFWWKAIVFSFVISLCVIMEGYDTSLMNNFFPFPAFKNRFGDEIDPDGGRIVSSRWQTIILNGTQVNRAPALVPAPSVARAVSTNMSFALPRSVASSVSSSTVISLSGWDTRRPWFLACSL